MNTIAILPTLLSIVTTELNTAVSLVTPRMARGSNMHNVAAYATRYAAEAAELAAEMALNRYTR